MHNLKLKVTKTQASFNKGREYNAIKYDLKTIHFKLLV